MLVERPALKTSKLSPLRYPGGKSVLFPFLTSLIKENFKTHITYIEPYAGGAGAALALLYSGIVNNIHINDASIAIFSFWHSLLNFSDAFINKFERTVPTLDEWRIQKQIFLNHCNDLTPSLDLGFATFFLNRTNHSGILSAGPIGGKTLTQQQNATYPISARYNKLNLRKKLEWIIQKQPNIQVSNMDALLLLQQIQKQPRESQQNTLIYLDPPYFVHGKRLYMDFYTTNDHQILAQYLQHNHYFKWILSYDNVPEIQKLYPNNKQYPFSLNYSAATYRQGQELLICANNISLTDSLIKTITRE